MIKKINYVITFLLLFTISSLSAQKFALGGGVPFNVSTEAVGLNLRAYYNLNEKICFGPELSYFFPTTEIHEDEEIGTKVIEFNFNAHYIFELTHKIGIYPVIGLNYTIEKEEIKYLNEERTEDEYHRTFGMNIGGGFHIPLSKFTPFAEYEYVLGDLKEHIITLGVFFHLSHHEEGEESHER